jgi:isoamylase
MLPKRRSCLMSVLLLSGLWLWSSEACAQIESATSMRDGYGAHLDEQAWVHFGVHAPEADGVDLLLFDTADATTPAQVIPMEAHAGDWRIKIRGPGVGPGLAYMYRVEGPREISLDDQFGRMFNENYPLGDPYAYETQNVNYTNLFTATPFTDITSPIYAGGGKSLVYDHAKADFPGHLRVAPEDLIVYELHVQDYTARLEALEPGVRGTYLGLAQSGLTTPGGLAAGIDHLVELGVTAVELMPVMEYDEKTGNASGRLNHWGYMTTNFLAPEARYASVPGEQVLELKQLIKAFHDHGIAVFLDVVYNHTGEQGPWVEHGRLAAKCYNLMCTALSEVYRPTPDERFFSNNTGTGNDVDFSGGDVRYTKRLVTDSLGLWHDVYGVDGFRFDLARVLADGSDSAADWIDNDENFSAAHLHAEPWDPAGVWWDFMDNFGWSYRNNRWAKWIGQYRDRVRKFSQSGLRDRRAVKRLIEGYGLTGEGAPASTKPWRSVNFIAVHDGYTLRDCTLFNDAGGSHNCWDSGGDENLRRERSKLLMGMLLTSQGVPLILQGDEFGRTKSGALSQAEAHNTYNYESTAGDPAIDHVNWIDWRLKDGDVSGSPNAPAYGTELFNWTKGLIGLRKRWSHFRRRDFAEYVAGAPDDRDGHRNDGRFTYAWEGPAAGAPSQLGVIWWGQAGEPDLMVVYNENWEPFTLSNLANWSRGDWRVLARSWLGDEADLCGPGDWEVACPEIEGAIEVKGRSMAILISDND